MYQFPSVSIIIVSWNALETIKRCLPSVLKTKYPDFEVLFADNASTDGSSEWIHRTHPGVRIVRHPENWAFCKGNNAAVPHARGDILVFLNNDVEVPSDWLEPLALYLHHSPTTAAVGPRILDFRDRDRFEYAGACGGFLDRLGYPFARGRLFDTVEADTGQYDDSRTVFWASGTCLAVRRTNWEESGGFDELFFMHMEEIDLCWRLQRLGYSIAVEPRSKVFHMGGASLAQGSPRKTYLNFRNNLLLLYRNLPPGRWPVVFVQRLMLDGIAILRSLLALRAKEAWAIVRAYAAAHRMKKGIVRGPNLRGGAARRDVLPSYRRSVVLDYFFRGQKRFSELDPEAFTGSGT